jgi:MFS family permease
MHGLYLLWWVRERHVPAAAVAGILAAGDLSLVALEVPTGWLADRCGHRFSLIVGSLVQVVGMLFCWLGQGVPGLLAASLLVALGDAFRSGADQALLYRSCIALEREEDFQRIEARAQALQLIALVAMTLAGGVIVETLGFAAGWLVETVVCALGLLIACAMVEPPADVLPKTTGGANVSGEGSGKRRSSAREFAPLIALIVPASLLGAAESAASFLVQTTAGLAPGPMTVFVAIVTLAEAAGSTLASRVARGDLGAQIALAGLGAAILAPSIAQEAPLFPAAVALSFLLGVALPLRAAAIQRRAPDTMRAQAPSFASACDKALTTVALLCVGARSDAPS